MAKPSSRQITNGQDPRSQIETVIRLLEGKKLDRATPVFGRVLEWLDYATREINDAVLVDRVVRAATTTFQITKEELYKEVAGITSALTFTKPYDDTEAALAAILPKGGWFDRYAEYTRQTEAPLSFHIFASFCVLGAALGRRCFLKMGFFNIYPNYCVVLIGPTGRVRKTSATDIAKRFIHDAALCPIMADAITPEALGTALARDGGHQFMYAPEFAVLFNRQKYNETLTTRVIRLLDCPETFEVETQARGKEMVHNVALTFLGCSTPSLFTGATPEMVTSSGFLNRFLLVVEEDTDREYCVPVRGSDTLHEMLLDDVKRLRKYEGEVVLNDAAFAWYKSWYHQRKLLIRNITDVIAAEVMERGTVHLLRTAMLIHLVEHKDNAICEACVKTAAGLLDFVEARVPDIVNCIKQTNRDQDAEALLGLLRRSNGISDHSALLRRSRLDAQTFRRNMQTLLEARLVREERRGAMHFYILQEEVGDESHS